MITAFKTYLQHMGYGKSSVAGLPRCVASFLSYHNLQDPAGASAAQILGFYEWLHIRPKAKGSGCLSESHINYHLYALRVFFAWLEATGRLTANPISALSFKRGAKKTREPLASEDIKRLFEAATTDRERAALHLLYSCGLRRAEAVMLDTVDIHYKARMLYVRRGKGCKRRAVPVTEKVGDALEAYQVTERKAAPGQAAFLVNKSGRRMSGEVCNALIKAIARNAGLERLVTPHYLRHSIATHLLEAGVPIEQVKDFLGHSHLEATQLYAKVHAAQLRNL